MLIDARKVPRGSTRTADVCIIGAGAAGITLARALAGTGVQVMLLESGPFKFDERTQALYKGKTIGLPIDPKLHFGLDVPRLRFFGGTTNHWAGYCRPFPELDLQTRSWVPRSGWPFGRETLDPYYARAQDVIHLGPFEYSLDYWKAQGLIADPLFADPSMPHTIIQVTNSPRLGPAYHDEIVNAPKVDLHTWANVTRIGLSDDGTSVDHLDVATLSGNRFTARAKVYVVATGGLEVPRLLLASNDRRPAGIGNEHDLVGRHFMEHVNIFTGAVLINMGLPALAPYTPTYHDLAVNGETRKVALQSVLLLAPELLESEALRSCEITFEYAFAVNDKRLERNFPGTKAGIELARAEGFAPTYAPAVRVLCEQAPNPASRVVLTSDKDELGMRRIALDWRLMHDDRTSMLRTLAIVGRKIGELGRGRMRVDIAGFTNAMPSPTDDINYEVNTGSHHIGTARMHASPTQGVVDPDCRVHSVKNLYVGGSAVFPTSGANTPTYTIVALALRLADHLQTVVNS